MGLLPDTRSERGEVAHRFLFHGATPITGPKHEEIRNRVRTLALWLFDDLPPCRERALALTALQEAMMWANAAVAIHTELEPRRDGEDRA